MLFVWISDCIQYFTIVIIYDMNSHKSTFNYVNKDPMNLITFRNNPVEIRFDRVYIVVNLVLIQYQINKTQL